MYSMYYNISTIILQVHYGIVPKMAAALPRWVMADTCCRRCWWERGSDVVAAMHLPSSWQKSPASGAITPSVSTAKGTKKCLVSRWAYFSLFLYGPFLLPLPPPLLSLLWYFATCTVCRDVGMV